MYSQFKVAELIIKKISGEISPDQQKALYDWRDCNLANLNLYNDLLNNAENKIIKNKEILTNTDKYKSWTSVANKLKQSKKRDLFAKLFAIVACIILLIVPAYVIINNMYDQDVVIMKNEIVPGRHQAFLLMNKGNKLCLDTKLNIQDKGVNICNSSNELKYTKTNDKKSETALNYNTIIVPRGGEYKLSLSDGTKVWLNSHSKLKYPVVFASNQRDVFLQGEAYFEVHKDSASPFVVNTNNLDIKVLGTSFNVSAYERDQNVRATLVEGKVIVANKINKSNISLLPNEQLSFNKRELKSTVKMVDAKQFSSWKDGRFVFNETKLNEIMFTLARWYDVEIFFLCSSKKSLTFTGDITRYANIDSILELLELTGKVKFTIKNNSIIVE